MNDSVDHYIMGELAAQMLGLSDTLLMVSEVVGTMQVRIQTLEQELARYRLNFSKVTNAGLN